MFWARGVNMEIVYINEDESIKGMIQEFCLKNEFSTWAYLPNFLQFQKEYVDDRFEKDVSFLVVENKNILAALPLFVEKDKVRTLSCGGGYLRGPLIKNNLESKVQKNILKKIFSEIDLIAQENQIDKVMMLLDPLSKTMGFNLLLEFGFLDSSINTNIVNLQLDIPILWKSLRKSYQSIINKGKRTYKVVIVDYKDPKYDLHEKYRILHHKCAGRVTRPITTFDLQYEMIQDDNAVLIGLEFENKFVAFSYFFHHNRSIYYASSSDDPEYEFPVPYEHIIIWSAIEYYKLRGFDDFEIGWQFFNANMFDTVSDKEIQISFFKRGFGGDNYTLYRGIKYYNMEVKIQELTDSYQKFLTMSKNFTQE